MKKKPSLANIRDYQRIEKVLEYLENHAADKPNLNALAKLIGLSPFHFQRLFKRFVGLSPKQFLDTLTIDAAKTLLNQSSSLLDASLDIGLSGPSRLHDLFLKVEAITPGDYKRKGAGLKIFYGFHATPFGECFIGVTKRGVCQFLFLEKKKRDFYVDQFKKSWPAADVTQDQSKTKKYLTDVFDKKKIPIVMKGTPFQLKVWQALMHIPPGAVISYEALAKWLHAPKACRAVASAVASNPLVYIIPCHRVIQKMGKFGKYQGGATRKKIILAKEMHHSL